MTSEKKILKSLSEYRKERKIAAYFGLASLPFLLSSVVLDEFSSTKLDLVFFLVGSICLKYAIKIKKSHIKPEST